MTDRTQNKLLAAAVAADPSVPAVNATEQCTCGHAAERHGLDAICNVDCHCTSYESWITPDMELAHVRRIAGDNAELWKIANGAIAELRELAKVWKTATMSKYQIDQIISRYDAAIKEAIK